MRTTLFLVLAAFSFTACTTYQYVRIDSSQLQSKQNLLMMDNDTMRVTYAFSGHGGDVTIRVFNKTSQPFFIDWGRSSLIRNNQSYTLQRRDAELIPPQTGVEDVVLNLADHSGAIPIFGIPDTAKSRQFHYPDGSYVKYKEVDYAEAISPMRLKSYLTFLMGPQGSTDLVLTHTFYAGAAMHSGVLPAGFGPYHEPGNTLYGWYQN